MEPRISVITLGVTDLERAQRFYKDGLGWKAASASVEGVVVFFDMGGLVLALFPREMLAQDMQRAPESTGSASIALAHNVRSRAEVDATLAHAARAGATILKPAHDAVWGGYAGYFADPDGYAWEIAWNPHWSLTKEGRVVLLESYAESAFVIGAA